MLPDFATMIAARPPAVEHDVLERGVRFHHATDAAFHDLDLFVSASRSAVLDLSALGLERGSARAIAHVGVELLIDEALARSDVARQAYISAVSAARTRPIEQAIAWRGDERVRFASLIERLLERGVIVESPPHALAERLRGILARRPRLAFGADKTPIVARWIVQARPVVVASVSALTDVLFEALRQTMAGPPAASDDV
jgi:hypothetical protein